METLKIVVCRCFFFFKSFSRRHFQVPCQFLGGYFNGCNINNKTFLMCHFKSKLHAVGFCCAFSQRPTHSSPMLHLIKSYVLVDSFLDIVVECFTSMTQ